MPNISDNQEEDCATIENISWSNTDNNAFYEAIDIEDLQRFAENGGLSTGCDMRALTPYWSGVKSIFDVGAGYGRTLDYLFENQFQGSITALERSSVLFDRLEHRFIQRKKLNLLHADIRYLDNFNCRFDLILMLWSVIAEFSPNEQQLVITKLAKLLKTGGQLILDTMPENTVPLQAYKYNQQNYLTKVNNVIVHTYEPNAQEVQEYAKRAGFLRVERLTCLTDIGRQRWLYILS